MCSARLCPLPVLSPNVERSFKLGCHEAQHRRKRGLFYLQHPAWGAHVTQLDCKSQLSGSLATLANDGQIRLAERVMPNQGILIFRQRSQTLAFRCRQHPTTRHGCLSTFVSDSLRARFYARPKSYASEGCLTQAGCQKIFKDKASAGHTARPGWAKTLEM